MHLCHDVHAVDDERRAPRHPQCDVQDRAVLRRVDPVAPEHRLGALGEARLLGQLEEQAQRLVGDAVLRVVEVDTDTLGCEPFAARRVGGEEVAQVEISDLGVVLLQGQPCLPFAKRGHASTSWATRAHSVGREAELLDQLLERSRRAECVHRDDRAAVADVTVPAERGGLLDRDAGADRGRKHRVAVLLRLPVEQL